MSISFDIDKIKNTKIDLSSDGNIEHEIRFLLGNKLSKGYLHVYFNGKPFISHFFKSILSFISSEKKCIVHHHNTRYYYDNSIISYESDKKILYEKKRISKRFVYDKTLLPVAVDIVSSFEQTLDYKVFETKKLDQVRLVDRISIFINENWRFDISLTESISSLKMNDSSNDIINKISSHMKFKKKEIGYTNIKEIEQLLYSFIDTTNNTADNIDFSIEIEYIPSAESNLSDSLKDLLKLDLFKTINEYKLELPIYDDYNALLSNVREISYNLNKEKIKNMFLNENRLHIKPTTVKQLVNNPKTLTYNDYLDNVLPKIDNYYITEKADGLRALVIIETYKNIITGNVNYLFRGLIKDKILYDKFETDIVFTDDSYSISVYDSEYINETYYVFDVLSHNNVSTIYNPFKKRLELLNTIDEKLKKKFNIKIKKFEQLTTSTNDNFEIYKKINVDKKEYSIDGMIFTWDGIYNHSNHFKWKPIEMFTIDFLFLKDHEGIDEYTLYSGINKQNYQKVANDELISSLFLKKLNSNLPLYSNNKLFAYPFMPSSHPKPFKLSKKNVKILNNIDFDDLSNKIVEVSIDIKSSMSDPTWIIHKIRDDRTNDYNIGKYFGNFYSVAESIWQSYFKPLSFQDLKTVSIENRYFSKDDQKYKDVRKINNKAKQLLINKTITDCFNIKDKISVLDIASGKGQDLFKYYSVNNNEKNAKISDLCMVDRDPLAVQVISERKYQITIKNADKDFEYPHLTIQDMDLNNSYKENIKILDSIYFKSNKKYNLIVCNFAIHYFFKDDKTLNNLIDFIGNYVTDNTVFMFTCFGAEKVNDLMLSNLDKWSDLSGKYSITKKYNENKIQGIGQKIGVLLPCSVNEYDEYLVNIDIIQKKLKKYSMGIYDQGNLMDMINDKSSFQNLSCYDNKFIELYSYYIFKTI